MAQDKTIKKLPKTEKISVNINNEEGKLAYIITEKFTGLTKEYSIYKIGNDNSYALLGKSSNPSKLEEKYVYKRKDLE